FVSGPAGCGRLHPHDRRPACFSRRPVRQGDTCLMSASVPSSATPAGNAPYRLTWPLVLVSLAALVVLPSAWPSSYVVNVLILAFIFAILATGLNLIFGYTGLL